MQLKSLKKYSSYLLTGFLLFIGIASFATDYYVSPTAKPNLNGLSPNVSGGSSGPFRYIQSALDIAKSGDVIYLRGGHYHERLTLLYKKNITIKSYKNEKVFINGTLSDELSQQLNWEYLRQERNTHYNNTQYIYKARLPKSFVLYNAKKRDYFWYRNYVLRDGKILWAHKSMDEFKSRTTPDTEGEASYFDKEYVYIAVNSKNDIDAFEITFTDYVWWLGGLSNVTIDGGPDQNITFQKSGNKALYVSGKTNNLTIKNVKFIDVVMGFYIGQCNGGRVTLDNLYFKNASKRNASYLDYKRSLTMQQSAVVFVNSSLEKLLVQNCVVEGTFYGFASANANAHFKNNLFTECTEAMTIEGTVENNIVQENTIVNCNVGLGLVTVDVGPVYFFDNLFISNIDRFQYGFNGEVRNQIRVPKIIKFWNRPNGRTLKAGKKVDISTNCHFYNNTFIAKTDPLTVGGYNNKHLSPTNSTFYNNIFFSSRNISNSTGFSSDGIDIDNNVFYSQKKNLKDDRLFIGWDGGNHTRSLKNTSVWSGNKMLDLRFDMDVENSKVEKFFWCKKSKKRLRKFNQKKIPSHYPLADIMNAREYPGSKIEIN